MLYASMRLMRLPLLLLMLRTRSFDSRGVQHTTASRGPTRRDAGRTVRSVSCALDSLRQSHCILIERRCEKYIERTRVRAVAAQISKLCRRMRCVSECVA